uniref:Uncharacterized protein n=1 Tax=Noccaea caerulescens TaxID=107243 RepID=A0A1J3E4F1_NOCCA
MIKKYSKFHKVLDRKFMVRRWSEYVHRTQPDRIWPKRIHRTKGRMHISFDWIGPIIRGIIGVIVSWFMAIKRSSHQIYEWIDSYKTLWFHRHRLKDDYLRWCIYCIMFIPCLPGSHGVIWHPSSVREMKFTSSDRLTLDMWEVKNKSHFADDSESAMRVSSARGEWRGRRQNA